MKCCVEGCGQDAMFRSHLKRCELHTIEHEQMKAREASERAKAKREAGKAAGRIGHLCKCGCGAMLTGRKQLSDQCQPAKAKPRHMYHDEAVEAMKEQAAINAASKPLPRVTLSDEERDALDREKRKSDLAADAALAERRRQVNADMLMARLLVGAVVPVIPTGYASPKVEYQPPQRARIFASDAASTWES